MISSKDYIFLDETEDFYCESCSHGRVKISADWELAYIPERGEDDYDGEPTMLCNECYHNLRIKELE